MDQTADKRQPWDQLEGEPGPHYARFLLFRNLGPLRSVEATYRLVAAKKGEKRRAPGAWHRASQAYRWHERAEQWDIHHLREAGCLAVARFVSLLGDMASKSLERIRAGGLEPQSWQDVLQTVTVLAQCVPPESILRVAEAGAPASRET